ncbi:PQQ-dependent sugar dehydrogenase [Bythopirellula polymerisocia]|uniref:Quinoprotein glucose dehydrogenase B n=1 Tax=Bythopirellula polymerisocia TaxID=2528003 RepID=A0A5C6CNH0_9BACT|nr:PQQ-dependent sugar dehydrogenase [Bythopirellula polymerisocia]TWU25645.1 Quinoprotein glucose dehydrogenase B precursor [Bythopirellula polymerisocia]
MARRSGYKYASFSGTLTTSAFLLAFGFLGVAYSFGAAVGLHRVVNGLNQPVFATFAPGDKERLFVLERTGTIKIVNLSTETIISTPFLSVPDTDSSSSEEGLLGLAFHPDYATNGKFYINVTVDDDGGTAATRTHIREYTVSENPEVANAGATELLAFNQPQSNHNGGWIGFSPNDGYLYIMTGDGGNGNDTGTGHTAGIGNSQDITSNLLGKALRIDVDGTNGTGGNYGIPASNPFVGVTGDDEIWAYGLRNPYRASFDRQTGDLWIGDVGQGSREEIDFQPASDTGGRNYGWRVREGFIQNPAYPNDPTPAGAVDPEYDYPRGGGAAVTGGYVYRGPDPELQGQYFFGDSQQNFIRTFDPLNPIGTATNIHGSLPPDAGTLNAPVSFAEDFYGNLYVLDYTGEIFRFVTDAVVPGDFDGNGIVDGDDLAKWEASYSINANADADDDGDSDGRDFLIWQRNLGKTAQDPPEPLTSSPLNIPEPSTLALSVASMLSLWGTRRR